MGFSENPKFFMLSKNILKRWRFIGIVLSTVGFLYFCLFNKINKKAELDSRTFTQFPGNSVLNKTNEEIFNESSYYFDSYKYEGGEHIIDILYEYIKTISPFIETEKHKIEINENVEEYILISNVPCKFCNTLESLIVVINFDYKERKFFHSLSVGLTLMDHFSHCNYMSKDIIFLFTNKELLYSKGIQEFIQLFFYKNIKNRKTLVRSATIIEFDSIYPSHMQINYEGLNGMLPNQDLVLLLTNELSYYNIPIKVNPVHYVIFDMALEKNFEKGHSYFLRENVPAFTATGISKIPLKNKMLNLFNFTKAMQSFLRNQSNTHEAFCHSSTFYFFNTIKRQVPISIYCYSVYLICCYCILKLMKSSIFRNYINFIVGLNIYIITILIISLPIYLFSTNEKIYDLLNLEKRLPLCNEWHPDHFTLYIKIANYWSVIFFISVVVAFFFNYFISYVVSKYNNKIGYQKVEKIERVIILNEIKNLNNKVKNIIGVTPVYDDNNIYEQVIINSNDMKKLIKPKIIHSDDEMFLLEKKNNILIRELQDEIDKKEDMLEKLENENVKYIYKNSVAPYASLMSYMNVFYFIMVVVSSSRKRKKIVKKIILLLFILFSLIYIYPYESFILNERHKLTNTLMKLFEKVYKHLSKYKLSETKYFPDFLEFLCSNKIFDYLYLNKYYLNNQDIKFNYNYEIKNSVLLNLYNLSRNHYCIGSQTYALLCFTFFPILFYTIFIFFC
ncbi:glycosylphosphatidylinositol anchor attachment 1 protein, putative [Plasmodium malariae]|uniref:Glycosylphosphatidylinositol anchor attachment 1 protein, putative n=1 Tax=Plasmodium malariae TaxID=5858 RepID=A0A1C3KYZ3_PLAMA|nr:glycosylphosphatidylinositol anchor attachment 1 protein, putative [Plasmodium malariae]